MTTATTSTTRKAERAGSTTIPMVCNKVTEARSSVEREKGMEVENMLLNEVHSRRARIYERGVRTGVESTPTLRKTGAEAAQKNQCGTRDGP